MLKLFVVAVFVAAVAADFETEWFMFKAKYNKKYTPEVEAIRKYIWSENMKFIEEHNKNFSLGLSSYYLGENEFADMTLSEFVSIRNGLKVERNYDDKEISQTNITSLPDTVDWRKKGYVTGVKDQKDCGSCWAFSTTGSLEGQHFKTTGKLVSLSESNLVDCTGPYGNNGCGGGFIVNSFEYVIANHGIDTEASYPYKDEQSAHCKFQKKNVGDTISRYMEIATGSESSLQMAVAEIGPISVAIDANNPEFLFYKGGILNVKDCSRKKLDHAVLAVGYGTQNGTDYWLVKNSWGVKWGMEGYVMMSRNKNNQCGIATAASYPVS